MMKDTLRLIMLILISVVAWLSLASVAQAGYSYNMKVSVDHTRVAGMDVSPPSGYGFVKGIFIDHTKVSGSSDLIDFPVLVSIQNDAALRTTANGGLVTDPQGDDLVFFDYDLSSRLDYEVEQYDAAAGTLVAWVRLPVLEYDLDTVFYLAYGNDDVDSSLENGPGVWDSNYKGVWHLKEATGATNKDSSGNGNDGTPKNSPAAATGKIAGALDFEGANQTRVELGTAGSLDLSQYTNWTISTWVKPSSNYTKSDYPAIYAYGDWEVALDLAVAEGPQNGRIEYYLRDKIALYSDSAINVNAWNHVVVVHEPAKTYFYLNGVADGSDSSESIGTDNSGSFIGGYPGYTDGDLEGLIDEVRVSNSNRSAGWIATQYNNQNDPAGFMTIRDNGFPVNFPVLVSIQNDAQLKTTANGGQVTDAEGDDIIFTVDAAGLGQLMHEVESYDGATGSLVAWVKLPVLSPNQDTTFYLQYGNSDVSTSQENRTAVWDNNFKGVWHLKEATGATNTDSTGNSNNGTPQNSPASSAGQIGNAMVFDGIDDYISLEGQDIEDHDYDAVTIEVLYKSANSSASDDQYIYTHHKSTWNDYVNIGPTDDGTNGDKLRVSLADGGTEGLLYGTSDVVDQQWHHLSMVRTGGGAGSRIKIYVDGDEETDAADPTGGGVIALAASGLGPFIGDSPGDTEQVFGNLDELRVSNTARSAEWIKTSYNNQQWPNKAQWPALGFITVQRSVCDSGASLVCGSTVVGSIEAPGAWDAFELTFATDTWVDIYTTGTTDTYGHLYDSNCVEIAQNDTVDYNFFISQTVEAGTYYVQVRHASELETGDYELNVECKSDDHGDNIDDASPLDCNSSIGGNIESGGDEDYFKVVFWGTGVLTAYTTDGNDPNGTLLDDAGNPLAADDNSGGGYTV